MCCYAGKLLQQPAISTAMKKPTLVVVTELVQMTEDLTKRMKAAYDVYVGSDGFKEIFEQAENFKKHQG